MENEQTITNDFTLDLGILGVSDFNNMEFEEMDFDLGLTDI